MLARIRSAEARRLVPSSPMAGLLSEQALGMLIYALIVAFSEGACPHGESLRVSDDGPLTSPSTSTGAVVRKPPGKETAMGGTCIGAAGFDLSGLDRCRCDPPVQLLRYGTKIAVGRKRLLHPVQLQ
jgi:hypothetical protein